MEKKKAIEKLERQHDLIRELKKKSPDSPEFENWENETEFALKSIFGTNSQHVDDFNTAKSLQSYVHTVAKQRRGINQSDVRKYYTNFLTRASAMLNSFIDEIEDWPDVEPTQEQEIKQPIKLSSDIFIVHGRDDGAKQAVARLIEKLGLKPIILHEQPNRGRTIIEKFETYGNPAFAVVLLTPDDVGALAIEKENLKPRARQNVIFELGFFIGKIGRKRVCALCKGNVERPSDYDGILYISMDDGGWELKLAKELKAAGIEVDLNRLLKN